MLLFETEIVSLIAVAGGQGNIKSLQSPKQQKGKRRPLMWKKVKSRRIIRMAASTPNNDCGKPW